REILSTSDVARYDPDPWAGLATVCWREGKLDQALQAANAAVQIDPNRADLHVIYARVLQSAGHSAQAEAEFKKARGRDAGSFASHRPIKSGKSHPFEIRGGSETDLLNYSAPYQGQSASFSDHWTPHISTNVGFATYQRSGIF